MQMVLVENLALTFVGDAHVLATGVVKILARIVKLSAERMIQAVMAPIERIARASDVAGVYANRQAQRRKCPLDRLNPFRGLRHLT